PLPRLQAPSSSTCPQISQTTLVDHYPAEMPADVCPAGGAPPGPEHPGGPTDSRRRVHPHRVVLRLPHHAGVALAAQHQVFAGEQQRVSISRETGHALPRSVELDPQAG
ncbi:unnamed protein product, partial [Ectocarpus sp. 12 AP-2014]